MLSVIASRLYPKKTDLIVTFRDTSTEVSDTLHYGESCKLGFGKDPRW